jgi:gas vesicle protein
MCVNCSGYASPYYVPSSPLGGYPVGCCSLVKGYYCIWTLDHATMECEEWPELCDLRSVLQTMSSITFNVVSERARARTALTNLKRDAPFAECKRFPWRKTFVNISCSVYSSLLQDLLLSLDYKDRETEKELKYGSNHKQDDKDQTSSMNSSLDDSKTRFRNTLIKFQNALCKKDEVYDRVKFEKKYNLEWCIGECPTEPGSSKPPNVPLPPDSKTYGDMMVALKKKSLDPTNFSVFKPEDMEKNDFQCKRETQTLGPGMADVKLPYYAVKVFLFARGEYAECEDSGAEVQGYVYDKSTGAIEGPMDLKKYGKNPVQNSRSDVANNDLQLVSDQWERLISIVRNLPEDIRERREEITDDLVKELNEEANSKATSSSSFEKI